jgi:multicomponent Na+:H+ antiporter subunit G
METFINGASWCLLLGGSFFVVTGGVGLLRLPDFFTRLHATSIPDTLGATMIISGLMLQAGWSQPSLKLLLIMVFMLFTGPTASHALAKSSLHGHLKPLLRVTKEIEP